jgi:tetratricopeptide (TPR) repeat protein
MHDPDTRPGVVMKSFGLAAAILPAVLLACLIAGALRAETGVDAPPPAGQEGVAGSRRCQECHRTFYGLWATSFHGLAMRPYSDAFAAANLAPQTTDIAVGQASYRAETGPGQGWVRERNGGGETTYRIVQVLGGKDVFYFLTPLERGRLQTLPVAYDVRKGIWFDMAESGVPHAPAAALRAVDWKDWRYTFNTACRGCHVSQLASNYDAASDSYHTTWTEPGINCETCHGPGQAHVQACLAAPAGKPPDDLRILRLGRDFTPAETNALCASCHAKAVAITSGFTPGGRFFDHFDLVTYESPDYSPDGRDLGENYTYTSWSRSPCVRSGQLDCVHCHTSSGRYKFAEPARANDACLPCHAPIVADAAGHSRHPAAGPGSRCVACHMPTTEFARMRRSDHSMLPPTPAASIAYGAPNACTLCHADHDPAWADAAVRAWYGRDYQAPLLHQADLVAAARQGDWSRLAEMVAYIAGENPDAVVAASLVRLLQACPDPAKWSAILKAAASPSPLVRAAAAETLATLPSDRAVAALLATAADDYRLVRVRAAASLSGLPQGALRLTATDALALREALAEYLAALAVGPDLWTSHYNLGNYYLGQGDFARAAAAFETASRLDPSSLPPLVNVSVAYSRLGENGKAEAALAAALKLDAGDASANFNMGLLRAELGDAAGAERHLRAALAKRPDMAEAAYNLGVLLASDRLAEALEFLRQAAGRRPDEPRYGYTLAFFLARGGDRGGAARVLVDLLRRHPDYQPAAQLLDEIGPPGP